MKISRILIIIIVLVVIGVVALFAYETFVANTSGSSLWNSAAEYPLNVGGSYGVGGQQCVSSTTYIYCVGGVDANNGPRDDVYTSSPISAAAPGITSWAPDTNLYPLDINSASCVTFSDKIYCIGGIDDDNGDDTPATYYASLNNGVAGSWNPTTAYPIGIDTQSCVASAGYVYCIGGNNETGGLVSNARNSTSVFYAPLSASGIGNWSITYSYPGAYYPTCFASSQIVYCLGGVQTDGNSANSVYYSSLSAKGLGTWTQTTSYPLSVAGQSCVILSGTIYCVGGEGNSNSFTSKVYYAPISSSGVGAWQIGAGYSDAAITNCVSVATTVYCVGGFDSSSSNVTPDVSYATLSVIVGSTQTTT